jgi:hypothetical protein
MFVLVMAHNDPAARATYERHKGLYGEHTVFSPREKRLGVPNEQSYGVPSHHGASSIQRFRRALAICASHGEAVIHEYDSVAWGGYEACDKEGVWCNLFRDTQANRQFKGTYFTHPPLVFRGNALSRVMEIQARVSDNAEGGFWDRWLGYVCEIGGIPMHDMWQAGLGFSRNTIEPHDDNAFKHALAEGRRFFHGVKRKETSELALRQAQAATTSRE